MTLTSNVIEGGQIYDSGFVFMEILRFSDDSRIDSKIPDPWISDS